MFQRIWSDKNIAIIAHARKYKVTYKQLAIYFKTTNRSVENIYYNYTHNKLSEDRTYDIGDAIDGLYSFFDNTLNAILSCKATPKLRRHRLLPPKKRWTAEEVALLGITFLETYKLKADLDIIGLATDSESIKDLTNKKVCEIRQIVDRTDLAIVACWRRFVAWGIFQSGDTPICLVYKKAMDLILKQQQEWGEEIKSNNTSSESPIPHVDECSGPHFIIGYKDEEEPCKYKLTEHVLTEEEAISRLENSNVDVAAFKLVKMDLEIITVVTKKLVVK